VGTNNLIRVVVEEPALRGYIYQFLSSRLGQDQLRANIYGAIVDHIEPDDVKAVAVPIPKDRALLEEIGLPVIRGMELREEAFLAMEESGVSLAEALAADAIDSEIARTRLEEIRTKQTALISGDALKARLDEIVH